MDLARSIPVTGIDVAAVIGGTDGHGVLAFGDRCRAQFRRHDLTDDVGARRELFEAIGSCFVRVRRIEQVVTGHGTPLAGIQRSVVVVVDVDGDSWQAFFAGITRAVVVAIDIDHAADRSVGSFLIAKVDTALGPGIRRDHRLESAGGRRRFVVDALDFSDPNGAWFQPDQRVAATGRGRHIRFAHVQYVVGVQVSEHLPATQSGLAAIAHAVAVQVVPHDAADPRDFNR